eukprot:COSAG05_NODE_2068_length_3615_cov_7.629977_3_plen_150_part_00
MRTSVLATVRAFSSQRRRAAGCRAGCRAGSPRARTHPTEIGARIQPDLRIQIVHALSQLDSCTRAWMGGDACDGMEVDRRNAAGRPIALRNKSAARKLKCAHDLRSSGRARARARARARLRSYIPNSIQLYWAGCGVRRVQSTSHYASN